MNFLQTVSICKQEKRFMRINKVITKRAVRCACTCVLKELKTNVPWPSLFQAIKLQDSGFSNSLL